jgi:thioredoxin reductase (NADPH)
MAKLQRCMLGSMSHHRLIIIGSGPAGLTAAIYAARADLAPLVIEGFKSGGQLMDTTEVENYPGFANGIMGPELMEQMREQAERFGATLLPEDVTCVDLTATPKLVDVGGDTYSADAVIIATGAAARQLGIDGEQRLIGRGVSTCATCDGFFFRNQRLVIVGGGDSSMEEALFLTRFASKVTIINRSARYRASKIMLDRAHANEKIEFVEHARLVSIEGEEKVERVVIEDVRDGSLSEPDVEGVFIAIGHVPATGLFKGQLAMDGAGYLAVGDGSVLSATSLPGVFAAGDAGDHRYRQAATSVGAGCMAAIDAEHYLSDQE